MTWKFFLREKTWRALFAGVFFFPFWGCQQTSFSVQGEIGQVYSKAKGYLQTPRGGALGTTSFRRPTFEELGEEEVFQIEGSLKAQIGRHQVFARGKWGPFVEGYTSFSETLISHGQTFLPDKANRVILRTYWIDFGYGYRFSYPLRDWTLELFPLATLLFFSFRYKMFGSLSGEPANRSYSKLSFRGGVSTTLYKDRHRFQLLLLGFPLPFLKESTAFYTLRLRYHLDVWKKNKTALSLFLETGYEYFHYRDSQQVPNHLHMKFTPQLGVGLAWRF